MIPGMAPATTGGGSQRPSSQGEEDAIIEAMNELSVEERRKVYNDVYHGGGGDEAVEVPNAKTATSGGSRIDACLRELDQHITRRFAGSSNKSGIDTPTAATSGVGGGGRAFLSFRSEESIPAIQKAMQMDSSYVQDRKLRISFLKSEQYNPSSAAEKMVNFFECKKELFGVDKLCKTITLEDLNKEDMEALQDLGIYHIPVPDKYGRHVVLHRSTYWDRTDRNSINVLRAMYYSYMSVDTDKSWVVIGDGLHITNALTWYLNHNNREFLDGYFRLLKAIPLNPSSVHMAMNDSKAKKVMKFFRPLFSKGFFVRMQFHQGKLICPA